MLTITTKIPEHLRVRELRLGFRDPNAGSSTHFVINYYTAVDGTLTPVQLESDPYDFYLRIGTSAVGSELEVIDFGGSIGDTSATRTQLAINRIDNITIEGASNAVNWWYGASDHPVYDGSRVPFLQLETLEVTTLHALDCFKCADGTSSDCPHRSYTDYACP